MAVRLFGPRAASAGFLVQSTVRLSARTTSRRTRGGSWAGSRLAGWWSVLAAGGCRRRTRWHDYALKWGEYGLSLQADDGSFYLINDDYFNTDIAADELSMRHAV
ncbi:MAG: hypothetical protein IPM16_23965 [Chloroflexi bacterium]|nr:hypothetical protein [Chloroflexota bacterium]